MISIISPVFNSYKYLDDFIKSIINQSFTDFELLLIDDNSSDESLDKCLYYQKEDKRIKVYHLEKNSGAANARNVGLEKAKGEFITFADSDDILPPTSLEIMYKNIVETNSDILFCNMVVVTPGGTRKINPVPKHKNILPQKEAIKYFLNFYALQGATCGKLYKKKILEDVYFPVDMKIGEDGVFCSRVLAKANTVAITDEVVYEYLQRNNSTSDRVSFNYQHIADCIKQPNYVDDALKDLADPMDLKIFRFETFRKVRQWEKEFPVELQKFDSEHKTIRDFNDRQWFNVFLYSFNIRIKIRALKYKFKII